MTTPNLDALAKRSPFRAMCGEVWPERGSQSLSAAELMAIANEWAELRAYRERTEAALLSVCAKIQADMAEHEFRSPAERSLAIVTGVMLLAGLWREPGQGATDGN